MNIIDWGKNLLEYGKSLLKKEKKVVLPDTIKNIYNLPLRENYISSFDDEAMLASYIEEYNKILSQRRSLVSIDLISQNLKKQIDDYITLIMRIMLPDKPLKISLEERVDLLVGSRKLNLYFEDIWQIQKEVALRFFALIEIFTSRQTFLSQNRKNAIINGVEILANAHSMLESQKVALYLEANAHSNLAVYTPCDDFTKEDEESVIAQKRRRIDKILKVLQLPRSNNKDILKQMAEDEKKIEQYVHKNNKWLPRQSRIYKLLSKRICEENKEEILKELDELIPLCQAYELYGDKKKNITSFKPKYYEMFHMLFDSDLKPLYWFKFMALTYIGENDTLIEAFDLDSLDSIEKECYSSIISQFFSAFVSKKVPKFKEYFKEDYSAAIDALKNLFFDGNHEFNSERILKNKFLLNLFLYIINDEVKVEDYRNLMSIMVKKEDFNSSIFHESSFLWQDEIPMESIFEILMLNGISMESDFYRLWYKHSRLDHDTYQLPMGLKNIVLAEIKDEDAYFIEQIRNRAEYKHVIMPPSLETFYGDLFGTVKLLGISLNEGLKTLGRYTLCNQDFNIVILPSTLNTISDIALNADRIKNIGINIVDGQTALDNAAFFNILKQFMCCKHNGKKILKQYLDEYERRESVGDNDKSVPKFTSNIPNPYAQCDGYDIILNLDYIFLCDAEGTFLSIPSSDLKCSSWLNEEKHPMRSGQICLTEKDVNRVVELLQEKIQSAIGKKDVSIPPKR